MRMPEVFDDRRLELGEGPLWHPERRQLFWFDILGRQLLTRDEDGPGSWSFDEPVSAAGWVSPRELLVASASALNLFDIGSGRHSVICPLEPDKPDNRSNDGRADPAGGFWIGTMSLAKVEGAGTIWRYFRGEMRRLFEGLTIPNAICFSPDGGIAYFADTSRQRIFRVTLDGSGWPRGEPAVFLDLEADGLHPDGAVVDREGRLWNAQWGASRIACYRPEGCFETALSFPASQVSCPAFGGDGLSVLYATTAQESFGAAEREAEPMAGMVFSIETEAVGQPEHQVIL